MIVLNWNSLNRQFCVIYTFDHDSETVLVIITCNIPNKRLYFSLSFDISAIIGNHMGFKNVLILKPIFSLLFFEHGFICSEVSLRFLIKDLLVILCQKTGNFWSFYETYFCRLHKTKTRT